MNRLSSAPVPTLILVTGWPATGKSSLAERFAHRLGWPLFTKDGIKESLFDSLGVADREWSRRLSRASYELLLYLAARQLEIGHSCIVEGNFDPRHWSERWARILAAQRCRTVQVHCTGAPEILWERFQRRTQTRVRHAGHADETLLAEVHTLYQGGNQTPLAVAAALLPVETTRGDFDWSSPSVRLAELLAADGMEDPPSP